MTLVTLHSALLFCTLHTITQLLQHGFKSYHNLNYMYMEGVRGRGSSVGRGHPARGAKGTQATTRQ